MRPSTEPQSPVARLGDVLSRFRRAEAGVAAIEFAFLLPVLLLFYAYLVEFSRAFDEKRKLDRLASTVSDLVSQQPTGNPVPSTTIASILSASAPLVAPFANSGLTVTTSIVALTTRSDTTCCDAQVKWTFAQGGTLRPCNVVLNAVASSVPPRPDNILAAAIGSQTPSSTGAGELVVTDVRADFTPLFGGLLHLFSNGFQRTSYVLLRSGGVLTLQSPASPQQGQQVQICS